jgi:hypothetical protein
MNALLLALVLSASVQDQLEGAEIGDANQYLTFQSGGKYIAERSDKKAGTTNVKGSWEVKGDGVDVKIDSCKGPACKEIGKPYRAEIGIVAERAMTVKSTDGVFSSGSYYCHYQGCEKRVGIEVAGHSAKPLSMKYVVDHLIDKNRGRNTTVVWWGKHIDDKQPETTITYCTRELEKAKKGAEAAAADMGELSWLGKIVPKPTADANCLFDVRIVIGDAVTVPPKR